MISAEKWPDDVEPQLLDLIETAILPSRGITVLELERFNQCFKRKGGAETADVRYDDCQDVFSEKSPTRCA